MFCCLSLIPVLNFPPANHMLPDETMPPANCNVKNIFHCQRAESVICSCCRAVNLDAPSEKGKRIFSRDCNVRSKLWESLSPACFCAMKMKYRQQADASFLSAFAPLFLSFSNTTLSIFRVKVMAHPENRGERDPPTQLAPKVHVVKLLNGPRSKSEGWSCSSSETFLFYCLFVCVIEERLQCCCWEGNMLACSHCPLDQSSERVIFGDVQEPGAPAESPYKEVLSGGWKVGYQLRCCSSMGPTRLRLVNTFSPSLGQIWPRLPEATRGLTAITPLQHLPSHSNSSYGSQIHFTLNTTLWSILSSTPQPPPSKPCPLPHLFYIIDEQQEQRCVTLWPDHCLRVNGISM